TPKRPPLTNSGLVPLLCATLGAPATAAKVAMTLFVLDADEFIIGPPKPASWLLKTTKNGPSIELFWLSTPKTKTLPLSCGICWIKLDRAEARGSAEPLFRNVVGAFVATPFHCNWNVVLLLPLSTTVCSSLPTPL